ncbi:MAG: serine/threonine-protein kinase [Cyanobacteria bacterium J06621_8]
MSRTSTSALRDGVILNNRYRIVKQIGRGGFGRAYLAEDTQRYRELCVLKEFAPQVEGDQELNQAEELFEREAGILYRLNHPQIPKFEALLKTRIDGRRSLFLVQEYIEGLSYWELLQRHGSLSEKEVRQMVCDVLPVLEYIHQAELIHRDISPDNLIRRHWDDKTALIDFGCVKLAANAVSESTGRSVTLIGKKGYSPHEQLYQGQARECSDLYSLAVSAIVLLTGKSPDALYDHHQGRWNWQSQAKAESGFSKVLNKMLAENPKERYQSAAQVSQILAASRNSRFSSLVEHCRTLLVAPGNNEDTSSINTLFSQLYSKASRWNTRTSRMISRQVTHIPQTSDFKRVKSWQWGLITAMALLIPGLISYGVFQNKIALNFSPNSEQGKQEAIKLSTREQKLQQEIYQKLKSLNINTSNFYTQVDQNFYQQYPELVGKQLTEIAEHQRYREIWYQIAVKMLDKKLENP